MPKINPKLLAIVEQMTELHADYIRQYGALLRQVYALGRSDERMGLSFDDTPSLTLKQLSAVDLTTNDDKA